MRYLTQSFSTKQVVVCPLAHVASGGINLEPTTGRCPQFVFRQRKALSSSSEPALLVVLVRLLDLGAGIHDKGSAARNWLVEWLAGHDQEACIGVGSL